MKRMLFMSIIFIIGQMSFAQQQKSGTEYLTDGLNAMQKGNMSEAFRAFKSGADLGIAVCQYNVAICYERGTGTTVDLQKAFNYMYKAATASAPFLESIGALGDYYRDGVGTSKDYKEALKWYYKGAKEAPINIVSCALECMFNIGVFFTYGMGTQQDYKQAVYWYKKSAELGHPTAALNLGNRYMNGEGVERNEVEAVKWWRKAADPKKPNIKPNAKAMYNMGLVYKMGIGGITVNKTTALQWFEKAASNGYIDALMEILEIEGK